MATSIEDIEEKIDFIHQALNNLQVAVTNLASKQQLRQLVLLKQKDLDDLKSRMDTVEATLTMLEAKL